MGIKIINLPDFSGMPENGDYFAVTDGEVTSKLNYQLLAQAIIEQYAGSELAGSEQTVQNALTQVIDQTAADLATKEDIDTNGAYTTLTSGVFYVKKHGFVNVFAHKTGVTLPYRSWTDIATLPEGYRPTTMIYAATVFGNNGGVPAYVRVHSGGGIGLYASEAISSQLIVFNVTFAVAEEETE